MPRIADYITIRDASFDLGTAASSGTSLTFNVTINSDAVTNRADSQPILAYKIRRLSEAPWRLTIDFNDTEIEEIRSVDISADFAVGRWEIFSGNLLHPGPSADNQVHFSCLGNGQVRLSDVVLWYQRDIPS
jgi:hypothetical protein